MFAHVTGNRCVIGEENHNPHICTRHLLQVRVDMTSLERKMPRSKSERLLEALI